MKRSLRPLKTAVTEPLFATARFVFMVAALLLYATFLWALYLIGRHSS